MDDAHTLRQVMRPPSKTRWRLTRLIATLGVILVTAGMYTSVAGRELIAHSDQVNRGTETWTIRNIIDFSVMFLHAGRLSLPIHLGLDAVFSVLELGGLALLLLIWRSVSPRGIAWLRWTYAAWLVVLAIMVAVGLPAWWQFAAERDPGAPSFITFGSPYILPGAAIFPLGVLVSGAALALLFREPTPASVPSLAPRTGWQWVASLTITSGVLIWIIGFYLMPEVITTACPLVSFSVTQFAHGACAGLDSDQVLQYAYLSGLNPIAFLLYTLGRNFELLVAGGCVTALGGWTRHFSFRTLNWLIIWPALAFGVGFVAIQGVNFVTQSGIQLTVDSGDGWYTSMGMAVTFAGICIVLLGEMLLWREIAKRIRAASVKL